MAKNPPNTSMGWRYVAYEKGPQCVLFTIEPMASGPDIVYVPTEADWEATAPKWAAGRYKEMVSLLKAIPWNRNLEWRVSGGADWVAPSIIPGTLESTTGGQWLESERLFHPDGKMSHEEAHQAWHRLAERFAQAARGKVTLFVGDIVENSVFQIVELPALKANPNVVLDFK